MLAFAAPQITAEQARDIRQDQIKTEIDPQINVAKPEQKAKVLPEFGRTTNTTNSNYP